MKPNCLKIYRTIEKGRKINTYASQIENMIHIWCGKNTGNKNEKKDVHLYIIAALGCQIKEF
jgi:hypothetical protein